MKKLFRLGFIALFVTSLILTSCSGGSATPMVANATVAPAVTNITVATYADMPPFESVNEQTKNIEGLDIDIMNAIGDNQNFKITFTNVDWDPLLAGMTWGMYDAAISSIPITEERKKDMLFSDPYFAAGQVIVVKKDNTTITGKDTLKGIVGVQRDTIGDTEVQKIKTATTKPFDDIGLAFQDLINGQVQAVVCDNPVALLYVGKYSDKIKTAGAVFTDETYGIAVAKGKTDLLNKINAGLKTVKAEGLIDQYSQKWFK